MKVILTVVASALFCSVAPGQMAVGPEQRISRLIESGFYQGQDEKMFDRMGDAAAVAVTKVLAGKSLGPREISGVVLILRMSFAAPKIVGIESDRQPRTTLFVLRYLDSSTSDPELRKKIAEAREFVEQQYQRWKKEESQKKQ